MEQLLLIKEKLKQFVGKNEVFITPVIKFLLTFLVLNQINKGIGFMSRIASTPITLIVALAGSFLPPNLTIVILALITLAHLYALSLQCLLIVFALYVILFLLYFRFAAKDSVAVLLTPLGFGLKIPYVLPVSMGLVAGPSSVASVGSGVIVYSVLRYISINADDIKNMGATGSKIGSIKEVAESLLMNRDMLVYILAFGVTIVLVHIVSRLSVDYCWFIAIIGGSIIQFLMIIIGNGALHGAVPVGGAFLGMIVSIIINIILQFFCFNLDYNRTEKVQFEDDEYYYYVKAVPKNKVDLPDKNKGKKESSGNKPAAKSSAQPVRNTAAREQVRKKATGRAQAADKGFLGLSGGRPAGEGRQRELRQREQQASAQRARNDQAAKRIVENFTEDDL
ncbi:MAG: hypothetical protein MJ124_10340 [Lachnospiraceae bacterium]|nr:hypothetical protein [Lachnospiraceae bacterium]